MSRWLFDLGNTRLKFAPLREDGAVGEVTALAHADGGLAQALDRALPPQQASALIASVASDATTVAVLEVLAAHFRLVSRARGTRHCGGVRSAYAEPSRLGVDRLLALAGAHARGPGAQLVVGIGTATTVDLLDRDGLHRGGRIAPSPQLMRAALHGAAAQLPLAGGTYGEFTGDTVDALASGCEGAVLGLIERSLRLGETLLGEAPALLLHGGGAPDLAGHLPQATLVPSLVLEGLARWGAVDAAPARAGAQNTL
jgi:type III pantothenate kinase